MYVNIRQMNKIVRKFGGGVRCLSENYELKASKILFTMAEYR